MNMKIINRHDDFNMLSVWDCDSMSVSKIGCNCPDIKSQRYSRGTHIQLEAVVNGFLFQSDLEHNIHGRSEMRYSLMKYKQRQKQDNWWRFLSKSDRSVSLYSIRVCWEGLWCIPKPIMLWIHWITDSGPPLSDHENDLKWSMSSLPLYNEYIEWWIENCK